jgi:ribonuclease D
MSESLEEIALEEADFLTHITKPIRNYELIDNQESLINCCENLEKDEQPYAIDAERASGFKYSQRAYLLQISSATSNIYLIDPTSIKDLTPLRQLLNNKSWILHAATQDLPCLFELELKPGEIFDTELAARLLSLPHVGLGGLLEDELQITLDKEHSAADWSKRPLPQDWLVYAALDVEFLHQLRKSLTQKLIDNNKLNLAQQEFKALCSWQSPGLRNDPWRRTSGMHEVRGGQDSAIVRQLWLKRDEIAQQRDIAAGRVLNDAGIIEIAAKKPKTVQELKDLASIKYRPAKNDAVIWFEQLQIALQLSPGQWPVKQKSAESYPAPKSWLEKRPEAYHRLQFVKAQLHKLSEELLIPVEHLCSPDLVKKWCWDKPTDQLETISEWLISQGARDWQAQNLAPVLLSSLDNPKVD